MMMNDDDNYIGDDGDGGGGGDDGDGGTIVEHDEDAAKVAEVVESDGLLALESICNDNDNDDDNDNDNDEDGDELPPTPLLSITTTTVVSLPLLLQFLYGLNGLTLSLLTLPVMYIVNTRVEVPLPYLPSYGAIAFLPYSLKPIYAYLCTINNVGDDIIPKVLVLLEQRVLLPPLHWLPLWMKRRWRRQHQNRRRRRPQQQYTHNNNHNTGSNSNRYLKLFSGLLTVNSILTVSFVCIPPKGEGGTGTGTTRSILLVFLVAFGRGFFDSWAEFCLGLTLIDFARKMDSEKQRTLNSNRNSNRSCRINQAQQNESQQQQQQTSYYNVIISQLQAQAATSTNLGAWLANFVTCLVFLERYRMIDEEENNNHDENKQQLSGGVANALILTTAIIQLLGAIVVYLYHHHRHGNNQSNNNCTTTTTRLCSSSLVSNNSNNNSNIYEELPTSATAMTSLLQQNNESINDDDTDNNDEENNGRTIISTELYTLYDEENNDTNNNNSHPSNSSLENLAADETERLSTTDSNHSNSNNNNNINSRSSVGIISNWVMVILLQLILLIIALKGPVIEWTSHYIWEVWVIILAFAILVTAVALYYNNSWKRSHRVGLFLIVRNAIPSDTMIVSSFFYYLFQSQPLVLQLLSFLGAGVSSFSSWSYTRLWSRYYSRGRPLLMLMGGTVVLASFASLLNIVVFRQYHHQLQELLDGGGSGGGGGSESATTTMLNTNIFVIAIISKFVITFFSEWAFLPEIVLASTSVEIPTTITTTTMTTSPDNDNDNDNDIIENREDIRNSSHHEATTDLVVASATITRPVLVLSTDDQENEHHTTINNTSSGSNSNNNNNSSEIDDDGKAIAIEYGTLLSCIDFGDQLGSLTAAPLVAFLNISRENGFLHMDRLIFICALTNIIVSLGLLPLLVEKKMK